MSTRVFYGTAICAALFSVVMWLFPQIDLAVSSYFYQPQRGFLLAYHYQQWHLGAFRDALIYLTYGFMASLMLMLIGGTLFKKLTMPLPPKVCWFLLLCFAIAPVLVINGVFKNHWGRARPHQVQQFGGDKNFTPAWVISNQCQKNCSFPSGETANVFCYLALALVARRKKLIVSIVLALGLLTALERIGQGDHFFSDTLLSGFLDFLLIWLIYAACNSRELLAHFHLSNIGEKNVRQY